MFGYKFKKRIEKRSPFEVENGPTVKYSLVFCFFPKEIRRCGKDGYFHVIDKANGILVRSEGSGKTWYHYPEDYIDWSFLGYVKKH